ncbi:hypothetical protein HPG69_007934 [Diceros bicornis minor]|uniref:Ras GTPase-activating protein 2 n=1 Tax=Diceros bicornis minor TaxID=77932 RepID=A0A7J7EFK5_DICBM|nr:hypothetical protein HPG69_007934 [Diceros bicornis minor]
MKGYRIFIKACHGLPLINGQSCDPYATVSLVGPSRNDQKKTKVKKKTSNPQFNEIFYFEVTRSSSYTRKSQFQVEEEDIEKLEIRIDLWNNGNLVQDVFLGEIKVPVNVLRNDASHQAWYLLQPRDNGNKSSKTDDLGSLRLNICYTEDYVLPSEYYGPLKTLLLKSPDVQPISASAAYILGEICRDKNDAVLPLVRLLLHHDKLVPFATAVAELDLKDTQDANTIFRGNSLATRCLDEMMKIVGGHYLKVTLKPILDEICDSSKSCEIDPIKLKEGDNVENNKENLRYYVDKLFSTIVKSSMSCPTVMCDIFYSLRQIATQRFPNDPHVQYSAVSSFVFLRFFAVAVVSPHTFHLRPHHPDAQTIRTLTLISKTIQTLGSWGSLSKSKSSFKESFMCEFFKMFQEEGYIIAVKKFLDEISSTETKESGGTSEPVHLKEGEMYKRAQGRTRIGKKNFKKRWFCLTSRELTYHKQPEWLRRNDYICPNILVDLVFTCPYFQKQCSTISTQRHVSSAPQVFRCLISSNVFSLLYVCLFSRVLIFLICLSKFGSSSRLTSQHVICFNFILKKAKKSLYRKQSKFICSVKQRIFILCHLEICKDAIYTIPVKNILAVEKLEESSFNKKNMFQVIHTEKPLYVQANNCVEANEWIDILCRVSRCNQNRLSSYHPSAYLNGSWLCCQETSENARGCKPCTALKPSKVFGMFTKGVPADIQIDIDEDRETERIYSLFTLSLPKLQKMEEACGTIAVYQGPQKEPDDYSNFVIEDSVTTFKTIQQIKSIIEKLDEPHEKYRKKRSSSAKYGSKENPIYLRMNIGFSVTCIHIFGNPGTDVLLENLKPKIPFISYVSKAIFLQLLFNRKTLPKEAFLISFIYQKGSFMPHFRKQIFFFNVQFENSIIKIKNFFNCRLEITQINYKKPVRFLVVFDGLCSSFVCSFSRLVLRICRVQAPCGILSLPGAMHVRCVGIYSTPVWNRNLCAFFVLIYFLIWSSVLDIHPSKCGARGGGQAGFKFPIPVQGVFSVPDPVFLQFPAIPVPPAPQAQDGAMLEAPDPINASTIFLGSELRVEFAVVGSSHQPFQLCVYKCVTSPSQDLEVAPVHHSPVRHHGGLVGGKDSRSHFLPREVPQRLEVSFWAFGFTGTRDDVYVHHQLLVWDPNIPSDATKKARSFPGDTNRWELLDDASPSSVCDCCEAPPLSHQRALAAPRKAPRRLPSGDREGQLRSQVQLPTQASNLFWSQALGKKP